MITGPTTEAKRDPTYQKQYDSIQTTTSTSSTNKNNTSSSSSSSGSSYTIGSTTGQNIAQSLIKNPGSSTTVSDGSTWTSDADGNVWVTKDGVTTKATIAGTSGSSSTTAGSGSSSASGISLASQDEKKTLVEQATSGSKKYGLDFQSTANQKIDAAYAAYSNRKQELIDQATSNDIQVNVKEDKAKQAAQRAQAQKAEENRQKRIDRATTNDIKVDVKTDKAVQQISRQIESVDEELAKVQQEIIDYAAKTGGKGNVALEKERNELKKQKKSLEKQQNELTGDYGVAGSLWRSLNAGAGSFNSAVTSTLSAGAKALMRLESLVAGDSAFTGSLFQPIFDLDEYVKDTTQGLQQSAARSWSNYGTAGNIANQLTQGVMSAVPNAALAAMTAGGSTAATLAPQASGMAATITNAVKTLAKSPAYWTSFIQSFGGSYDEALEKGADEDTALLASLISSTANAIVEIGGGVEQLPGELRQEGLTTGNKIRKWVESSLDEGKEEVIQGMIERLVNKAIYNKDAKWFSTTDDDAVINPVQSLQEGAMGTAVGGILGGGQMLTQSALNAALKNRIVDSSATATDQAILDALRGVQTPESATQTRQATAMDNAILQAFNQNKNTSANVNENVAQAEVESTAVNDNPATHTQQEQAVIEAYKQSVNDGLKGFIERVRRLKDNGFRAKIRAEIETQTDNAVQAAAALTGVDTTGYTNIIKGNAIQHIDKRHGINGTADHSMQNIEDFARIGFVLDNFTDAEVVANKNVDNDTAKLSKEWRNSDNTAAPLIRFSMPVNGTYYVVEAVPASNAHVMAVVSAYMTKGHGESTLNQELSLPENQTSSATSETNLDSMSGASDQTVSPTTGTVNTQNQVSRNFVQSDGAAPGAMRSQFESYPQQSRTQSNTIGKMESEWGVPYEQQEPIMYDTISEDKSLDNARLRLAQDYEGEMSELQRKHNWSGEEVDMGMTILDNYRRAAEQTGDWSEYSVWRKTVSEHGTEAARALQAYAKYSRQTGGGIVADAAALLDGRLKKSANKDQILDRVSTFSERYDNAIGTGQKNADTNVDELLAIIRDASKTRKTGTFTKNETPGEVAWAMNRIANYARAEAQDGGGANLDFLKTFAANSIYNIAADYKPVPVGQVVKTVYRNNLLSKIATVFRNLVSNNVFDIIDSVSRDISVPLDMLLSNFTGTRSVTADVSWFSRAKRKGSLDGLARSVMQIGLDVDATGNVGRYGATANRTFKMNGGVVSRLLSMWEVESGYLLNSTDEFQKGGIEASTQAGIDKLYEQGKIKGKALQDAKGNIIRDAKTGKIKYAEDNSLRNAGEQEALYRTFQDDTILSDLSTGARKVMNKISIDGEMGLGDFTMPFAQVPSNLGARAIEYSPDGLVVATVDLAKMLYSASKGEMTAAQQAKVVQGFGRAINGTALIAIAAAASMRGHIKVSGDDDDANKNALEKVLNLKGIQINLSSMLRDATGQGAEWQDDDLIVSLEFLEPLNAQIATGAMIAADLKEANKGLNPISFFKEGRAFGNSFSGALEAVMETPVMSTLQEFTQNYKYSDATDPGGKALDAAQKYVAGLASSIVPNAVRGLAQGLDDTERDAYTSDNVWEQAVDNFKASIPGLRETLPAKKDVWGNDVKNEGGISNFMNRNINPGTVTRYKEDEVAVEIDRISEATGESLYPQRYAPRSINVDGESIKLSTGQRDTYQEVYGAEYREMAQSLMDDKGFKSLPIDIQAVALKKAEKVAENMAKDSVGVGFEMSAEDKTIADMDASERVNELIVSAIKQEKYVSEEARNTIDAIESRYDEAENYQELPENVKKTAKKELETYYAAVEAAKYGNELSSDYKKLADMDEEELANHFIAKAIGSEKYLTEDAQKQLKTVQSLYDSGAYMGVSSELLDSAKEKAEEYFKEAEQAKYGGKLSEEKRALEGMNQKNLAEYFLEQAANAKFKDANDDGTRMDEILDAYQDGEISEKLAMSMLGDQVVDAYADFGKEAGVTAEMVLQTANAYARMETEKDIDDVVTLSIEAQLDDWLDEQNWTDKQKQALRLGYYTSKVDSYNNLVKKLENGSITVGEAKKSLTSKYQSAWTHEVSQTGVEMQDYIKAITVFEDAPSADERDAMGFGSKWQWYCNELNKTDLTAEQKFAVVNAMDTYAEKTQAKIAKAVNASYVETGTGSGGGSGSGSGGSYGSGSGSGSGGTSSTKSKIEIAYERFGKNVGVTESMMQQAKDAKESMFDIVDLDGNTVRSTEEQFDAWLAKQSWTEEQKEAVRLGFYTDSVKNLQWLSSNLRAGNISVAEAKFELSPTLQTGWSKNVLESGASMADYLDAVAVFKQAPTADERKALGYSSKWEWWCDKLNETSMTSEQKYAVAISVQDYGDSTKKKIAKKLGWTGKKEDATTSKTSTTSSAGNDAFWAELERRLGASLTSAADSARSTAGTAKAADGSEDFLEELTRRLEASATQAQSEPEETYQIRTDEGYRQYLNVLSGKEDEYTASDGTVWTKGEDGEVYATKNGKSMKAEAVFDRADATDSSDSEPEDGYTVNTPAGKLAYQMLKNGVLTEWDASDGWTWKRTEDGIIAVKKNMRLPVRLAG